MGDILSIFRGMLEMVFLTFWMFEFFKRKHSVVVGFFTDFLRDSKFRISSTLKKGFERVHRLLRGIFGVFALKSSHFCLKRDFREVFMVHSTLKRDFFPKNVFLPISDHIKVFNEFFETKISETLGARLQQGH